MAVFKAILGANLQQQLGFAIFQCEHNSRILVSIKIGRFLQLLLLMAKQEWGQCQEDDCAVLTDVYGVLFPQKTTVFLWRASYSFYTFPKSHDLLPDVIGKANNLESKPTKPIIMVQANNYKPSQQLLDLTCYITMNVPLKQCPRPS